MITFCDALQSGHPTNKHMIDTNALTQAAQEAIRTTLIQQGHIGVPKLDTTFEDEHQQQSYECFIAACKTHLKYLQTEGFVVLDNNKYVLRTSDELTAELESI
jgi:hypothetical protein